MNLLQREWQRATNSLMARNAGWMFIGQAANLVLQAVYFVILGRLLGSAEYGIFVGAFAFINLVTVYSSMGSGTVLLRYVSSDRARFAVYWGNVLLTILFCGGIIVAIAYFVAPYALNPQSAALVLLAGIANCFCGEITRNAALAFQAHEDMKLTAILNFATNAARLVAAASLFFAFHRVSAYVWMLTAVGMSALAAVAALVLVLQRYGKPAFSFVLMWKKLPEGFNYSFALSTTSVYNDVDKSILSHYGMNVANGIYSLAYRVIDAATTPVSSIRDAALPRFFREGSSNISALKSLVFRIQKRAFITSILVSAALYLIAPVVPMLAGKSFAESASAVRWLCLLPIIRGVHGIIGNGTLAMGKQIYRTIPQVGIAGFNFLINLYWIPRYGWRGAAWSSLLSDGLLAVCNTVIFLALSRKAIASANENSHIAV